MDGIEGNPPYIPRFDRHLRLSSQTLVSVGLNTCVCHVEHKCLSNRFSISDNQCIKRLRKQACELIPPTGKLNPLVSFNEINSFMN